MRRVIPTILVVCLLSLSVPVLVADEERQQSGLVEREEVRLIGVSFLAFDGKAKLITDLLPEEIEIRAGDEVLRLASLETGWEHEVEVGELPEVRLGVQTGNDERIVSTSPRQGHFWAVLVDAFHELSGGREAVEEALKVFIEEEIRPWDHVAVLSYGGHLEMEQEFTTDREQVLRAVSRSAAGRGGGAVPTRQRVDTLMSSLGQCVHIPDTAAEAEGLNRTVERDGIAGQPGAPPVMMGCVRATARSYVQEMWSDAARFYEALEGTVRYAGGAPGTPSVVVVSHGVTTQPEGELVDAMRSIYGEGHVIQLAQELSGATGNAADRLSAMVDLAVQEGIVFHVVDPTKLTTSARSARRGRLAYNSASPYRTAWEAPRKDLQIVTTSTGGLFHVGEDVLQGLNEARERERGRYLAQVYAPDRPIERSDLQLRSKRDGVRVTSRFDLGQAREAGEPDFSAGIALRELRSRPGGGGRVQDFLVGARQTDLGYEEEEGKMVADLTLTIQVETLEGEHLTEFYHFFRHAQPKQRYDADPAATLAIGGWLEAPPGAYRLKASFRNAKTGREGRAESEVSIPGS